MKTKSIVLTVFLALSGLATGQDASAPAPANPVPKLNLSRVLQTQIPCDRPPTTREDAGR